MEQAVEKHSGDEKKSLFSRFSQLSRAKKIIVSIVLVIFGAYIALVIARVPHALEQKKTAEAVARIHASKLTLDDVMGKNLPPDPGPNADKTVEGVDVNKNGIRDDVELAIFKLHPDSARIRAAELQYAKALQVGLTSQVFNTETAVAMAQERGRGFACIYNVRSKVSRLDSQETISKALAVSKSRVKEVEGLVFNIPERKTKFEYIYEKYVLTYRDLLGPECDIDPASLPD